MACPEGPMTTLAVFLGMRAIGATVWALETHWYHRSVKADRDHWHEMHIDAVTRADRLFEKRHFTLAPTSTGSSPPRRCRKSAAHPARAAAEPTK